MAAVCWVPGEASLLGLQMAEFPLCPDVVLPQCMHMESERSLSSSSDKDTNPVGLRPHPYDLTYLLKVQIQ